MATHVMYTQRLREECRVHRVNIWVLCPEFVKYHRPRVTSRYVFTKPKVFKDLHIDHKMDFVVGVSMECVFV